MPKDSTSTDAASNADLSAELSKLRRVRGGHKAYSTKTLTQTSTILDGFQSSDSLKLRQNKKVLEEKLEKISDLDDQILGLLDDEHTIATEINESGDFREAVYEILFKIEDKLREIEITPGGSAASSRQTQGPHGGGTSFTKLPKLQLRKFNGKPHKFQEFWDSFHASVDSNPNLNDALKLEYLKSQCEGAAYQAVAGFELSDANYKTVVDILKGRFGQRQTILDSHIDALTTMNPLGKNADIAEIRKFYDTVETHCRGLQAIGVDPKAYSIILVNMVQKKLPEEIRLILSRKMNEAYGDNDWQLADLLNCLRIEIEAREKCAPGKKEFKRVNPGYPTAAALTTGSSKATCTFCKGAHNTSECHVVTDIRQRKNILKREGRCYLCLRRSGHLARDCQASIKCFSCKGRHHVALCENRQMSGQVANNQSRGEGNRSANFQRRQADQASQTSSAEPQTSFCGMNVKGNSEGKGYLLQTAFVIAGNPEDPSKKVKLRLVIDSGSQRSYVTHRARALLELPTTNQEEIIIKAFGADEAVVQKCDVVPICLKSRLSDFQTEIKALEVPSICSPLQGQAIRQAKSQYAHLNGLKLADYPPDTVQDLSVDILLGCDVMWKIMTGEIIRGHCEESPVAIGTHFGWVLSGPVENIHGSLQTSVNLVITSSLRTDTQPVVVDYYDSVLHADNIMERKIDDLFNLEALGISEIDSVHETFTKDIKFVNGHYVVRLPWREHHDILPDNYELIANRLSSTLKHLRKDPPLLLEYDRVIQEQAQMGIIEEVKPSLINQMQDRVHYLSHHAVVRKEALTTKVRVVMDGSAKVKANAPSLNECLHTGPSLTPNILDILLRFRWFKVALVSDIEKAFHMISVNERDRDALRFLWIDDVYATDPKLVCYHFSKVVFGLNCSPFLLGATFNYHIQNCNLDDPTLKESLIQSTYVDDVVMGADTVERAHEIYAKSKAFLLKGGFNLHKWRTSDETLQNLIDETEVAKTEREKKVESEELSYAQATVGDTSQLKPNECKVLGIKWNTADDNLRLTFERLVSLSKGLAPTKRNLLKLAASLFDPLGFISPVAVRLKILLQEACLLKLEWDMSFSESMTNVYLDLLKDLEKIASIILPRCYFDGAYGDIKQYSLHAFCDASNKAYCAVIYLVTKTELGYHSRFIASKSRVVPLKKLTIPRLELIAALILARLLTTVKNALENQVKFESINCWSDSTIVLSWLKNDRSYKQFVSHRTKEILRLTSPDMWRHCPTECNPADLGSRGQSAEDLKVNQLWWNGPEWLESSIENYPVQPSENQLETEECYQEMRREQTTLLTNNELKGTVDLDTIIDANNFSSYNRLMRVTALVIRFISNMKSRVQRRYDEIKVEELEPSELERAEVLWIKTSQIRVQEDPNFKQLEHQLGLFKDSEGILRCQGRIKNSSLKYETKFPALLTGHHYLTNLITQEAHEKVLHNGLKSTLNEVRSKFWITRGRQRVKKVIKGCNTCMRYGSKHYQYPAPPQLPDFRVEGSEAFESVGTDLAGPLFTKHTSGDKETHKVWIVIFTCALSRAVHLEIMQNMSAEQFIMALRRFISRRGKPNLLISDNAKTFKKSNKILQELFENEEVKKYLTASRIKWTNILSKAPWMGSIYERLIKSVKRSLKKILRNASVTQDELYTLLVEIEGTLNNRPLTYLSAEEFDKALTPSHLICGRRLDTLPDREIKDVTEENLNRKLLLKRQEFIATLLKHWWNRWKHEYLVNLCESHNLATKKIGEANIFIGDVVTVHEDKTPRGFWRLGKVEELLISKDNRVRGATVKVSSPTGKMTLINRPLSKLFPVEIKDRHVPTLPETSVEQRVEIGKEKQSLRPKRIAALDADTLRRLRDTL